MGIDRIDWKTSDNTFGFGGRNSRVFDRLSIGKDHRVVEEQTEGEFTTFRFDNGDSVSLRKPQTIITSDGRVGYVTSALMGFDGGAVMNSPDDQWLELVLTPS